MKKHLMIILLLMFGFVNMTYAKPNKQETIDYIMKKVSECRDHTFMIDRKMLISIKNNLILLDQSTGYTVYRNRMPLSSLSKVNEDRILREKDVRHVKFHSKRVDVIEERFEEVNNTRKKLTSCKGYNCNQNINSNLLGKLEHSERVREFVLYCRLPERDKITKAFNHLIELLQESKENEKELF